MHSNFEYTKGTVPFVYFSAKKLAEMFGGFEIFLYLCIINQGLKKAGSGHPV